MNEDDKIKALEIRLENLSHKQVVFLKEIKLLRQEIQLLKANRIVDESESEVVENQVVESIEAFEKRIIQEVKKPIEMVSEQPSESTAKKAESIFKTENLEKFIGENLISKIGILITIIGVVIGAKYSIEHNLISPLTRIILGYLVGVGLLGFGIKLKEKYENYSAVLVSGAIAIMYFITFAAYDFYALIPQLMAFALMVLFTIFTVIAALNYDKQVIALIGLVGAYAVPFFLSNGSGDMLTFFTYITIINIGILIIAFRKYWKLIYYAAFGITWLIYLFWYVMSYNDEQYFGVAIGFATVFFILFYATFLSYKLIKKESFEVKNATVLLLNSLIFFGIGYTILDYNSFFEAYLGFFALANGIVHFAVSAIIYKQNLYDKKLLFFVLALVLVFITIAIPIQLDGNWVTVLWAVEAALLFWIGRSKQVPFYEKMAVPLMVLAFFSIVQDWGVDYHRYYYENTESKIIPIFNTHFLTSVLFVLSFGFIHYFNRNLKFTSPFLDKNIWGMVYNYVVPSVFLVSIYTMFFVEISNYFYQLFEGSLIEIPVSDEDYKDRYFNHDWQSFRTVWLINYTMIFMTILSFINIKKIKNKPASLLNLLINALVVFVFLIIGVYELSRLQSSYFSTATPDYYDENWFYIGIKYLSFLFLGGLLFACYRYIKEKLVNEKIQIVFDILLHVSILWVITSEFIAWMKVAELSKTGEFGISIIWGVYALIIIGLGIWKKKKHLRIGAIVLFALTLYKVFAYDISHFNTISKTIVLVALGILLLIISFLYNKYKDVIFEEEK